MNLHVGHAQASKNVGDNRPAGAVHRVDANFIPDFASASKLVKLSIALRYEGRKSTCSIAAAWLRALLAYPDKFRSQR